MTVIVKYIVERNGVEKMTFTSKQEADAYDKQLDIADNLASYLAAADSGIDAERLEQLAFFMAQHSADITAILKGSPPPKKADKDKPAVDAEAAPRTKKIAAI